MRWGTLGKVRDGSLDPRVDMGWVGEPSRMSRTGRGPSRRSRTGRGTLRKVRDGLKDPGEVRYGSGDPRGDSIQVR